MAKSFAEQMSHLAKSDAVKVVKPTFADNTIKSILVNKEQVDIRLDAEGRANMNDIHRASGGAAKKKPSNFLANKKSKQLAMNLASTAGIPAVLTYEGQGAVTGTFCHVDLLLAYAAWIDADFYVTVAKTFGNVARGDISRPSDSCFSLHWF